MSRAPNATVGSPAVLVVIRHLGEWDQDRHGAAFLRPIVDGERRRLAVTAAQRHPPVIPATD